MATASRREAPPVTVRAATTVDRRRPGRRAVRTAAPAPAARSPTACSGPGTEAEDAVQETWLRLSRSERRRDRQPGRLADHGGRPGLHRHAARPPGAPRGLRRHLAARAGRQPPRTGPGRRTQARAGRLGRSGAARRAGHAHTRRSGSPSCCTTCSAVPFERDRADARPHARRPPASSPAARAARVRGAPTDARPRPRTAARGGGRVPGRRPRRRLRRAGRGARPRRRVPHRHRRSGRRGEPAT